VHGELWRRSRELVERMSVGASGFGLTASQTCKYSAMHDHRSLPTASASDMNDVVAKLTAVLHAQDHIPGGYRVMLEAQDA
jgi:hypothetical protein